MAFWFVLDNEIPALFSSELACSGLLGIEVVETRLAGYYLAVLRQSQSFCK